MRHWARRAVCGGGAEMADLRTPLLGLELRNPFLLASGPLSHDAEAILRAHRAGAGGVVTKTISRQPAKNPIPHISIVRHGVLNREQWSELSAEQWMEREIPAAKAGGAVVIASLGLTAADVRELAAPGAYSGADLLELVTYTPRELTQMVDQAVSRVAIPVLAKVNAQWPRVEAIAMECLQQGAQGITATDSLGPALRISVRGQEPVFLGGSCWYSGPGIFPLALRAVAGIASNTGAVVVGTGGVSSADDALEMLMAGAHAVGVCTLPLTQGLAVFSHLTERLTALLDTLGFGTVGSVVGGALPAMCSEANGRSRLLTWNEEACVRCGRCVELCPYTARPDVTTTDPRRCRRCGLCVSICPASALELRGDSM